MSRIKPLPLVAALSFFLSACFLISLTLSEAYLLELTASAKNTGYWQVFFSSSPKHPKYSGNRASGMQQLPAGKKTTLSFPLRNFPVTWIRIDTDAKPGTVRLYTLEVKRRLTADKVLTAEDIYNSFRPGHGGVSMSLGNGFVEIISTGDDPYIVSRSPIFQSQHLGFFVVPIFLLSFFFYQRIRSINLQQVYDFLLVGREVTPGNSVIAPLDGLRGVAALMVIAEHTWPRFIGLGASGVVIFFVLSGFLLARPLVATPAKILQRGFLLQYWRRRLQRILPMYYFYILLTYVMSLHLGDAILHAFFLKADGHLWVIPQEMLFYLVFPGIALMNLFFLRGKIGWILPALLLFALLSNRFLGIEVFSLLGMNNQPLPFYLGVFVSGCCASYLYFGWYVEKHAGKRLGSKWRPWFSTIIGCSILGFFLLFSNGRLLGNNLIYSQQFYGAYGVAAAILLLSLLIDKRSFLVRAFSWPFIRSIGVVSYSLYLLHPLVLQIILNLDNNFIGLNLHGGVLFVVTVFFSLPVAIFTYRFIEYPFLNLRPR
jgi:peptidoglycan/LPS O-acetylase OafA/YrhL